MEATTRCSVCQKPTTTRCSRCASAYYCSAACQRANWSIHKLYCQHPTLKLDRILSKVMELLDDPDFFQAIPTKYRGRITVDDAIHPRSGARCSMNFWCLAPPDPNLWYPKGTKLSEYFTSLRCLDHPTLPDAKPMSKEEFWTYWLTSKCSGAHFSLGEALNRLISAKNTIEYDGSKLVRVVQCGGDVAIPYVNQIHCYESVSNILNKSYSSWDCDWFDLSKHQFLLFLLEDKRIFALDLATAQYGLTNVPIGSAFIERSQVLEKVNPALLPCQLTPSPRVGICEISTIGETVADPSILVSGSFEEKKLYHIIDSTTTRLVQMLKDCK